MGTPTMGAGPTTPWSDDGSGYDAGPYNLPNDGSQWSFYTVMVLLARIINSLGALYSGGAMQVGAYSGTIWTIAAGSLTTFLHLLADKAAKVDSSLTTFSGKLRVGSGAATPANAGDMAIAGKIDVGEQVRTTTGVRVGDGSSAASLSLPAAAYITKVADSIGTTSTTKTIDTSYSVYEAEAWVGGGGAATLACTISNHGGADFPEVEVRFYPLNAGSKITFTRQGGGGTFLEITAAGAARFRWNGTKWAAMPGCCTFTGDQTKVNFTGIP